MGSGEDAQFVFAKYDYTAQGNQVRQLHRILWLVRARQLELSFAAVAVRLFVSGQWGASQAGKC